MPCTYWKLKSLSPRALNHHTARMAWTWQEIKLDWLAGGRIAAEPGEVVAAFDRVEACFGREWIDQSRILHVVVPAGSPPATTIDRGSYPVVRVVAMGKLLASLAGIRGAERLIDKLRQGDRAARAEATAIQLLKAHPADSIVELEPVVSVAGRADRRGDFRVRHDNGDPWTYVEVSATDQTATERETLQLLARFTRTIRSMRGSFSVELFFHNPPDDAEVTAITRRVADLNGEPDSLSEELPGGLGVLLWDKDRNPIDVSPRIGNVPYRPGLGRAEVVHVDGEVRSIAVRLPYADTRGGKKLGKESKQLPKDEPGLLMLDTSGAPGSQHSWEPAIRQDLRQHGRVGAVFLFCWGLHADDQLRESILVSGRLIVNSSARRPLPSWIVDRLSALPDL